MRLSLASIVQGATSTAQIAVDYLPGADGDEWLPLGSVAVGGETSNATNGGFFLFSMPLPEKLSDLKDAQIRLSYAPQTGVQGAVYLDAAWLEASFPAANKKMDSNHGELKKVFKKGEMPSFVFSQLEDKRNFF